MPSHNLNGYFPRLREKGQKMLTVNEEPNVGQPYASRHRYDVPVPIPNGDAGGS
jgi:hypothetical protein